MEIALRVPSVRIVAPIPGKNTVGIEVPNEVRQVVRLREVIEEASIGGMGAHVLTMASDAGLLDTGLKIRTMRLPDVFQDQDSPAKQYDEAGLNAPQIVDTVLKALRHNSAGVEEAGARA